MVTSILPDGFKYLIEEEKFCSAANFECSMRIRGMRTEDELRKWIGLLGSSSLVTWKILRTYPNSGKINVYKAEFRCQHRVHGKQKQMKKSKNTNCPARLRVCIRRYLKSSTSKYKDPLTKLWPCLIELKNTHNHCLESADSLQYRPVNEETKNRITDFFQKGHSPVSVIESLKLALLLENPELYEEREKDGSYCPLTGYCYRIYSKLFGCNYRSRDKNTTQMELEALLGPYINDDAGGRALISTVSEHLVICICTPIMQRIHRLVPESRGLVNLHKFGNLDKKNRLFLFTTWIAIGEVPLGVIITDTESQEVFATGLQLLKNILPADSFFGACWPEVIVMEDDDSRRREGLSEEFPQSLILTSKCHLLGHFMEFLQDEKNEVLKPHSNAFYQNFKVMLNSEADEDLVCNFEKITTISKPAIASNGDLMLEPIVPSEELIRYMNALWTDSTGFSTIFRPGLFASAPANSAPAGVQILSRIIQSEIFERIKNFSLVQLTHFIIAQFEGFISYRLTQPNYMDSLLKVLLPARGQVNLHKIKKLEEEFFEVPSENGLESKSVDMDLLLCTCGRSRLCKHQSAIIHKYYAPHLPYPHHLQSFYKNISVGTTEDDDVETSRSLSPPKSKMARRVINLKKPEGIFLEKKGKPHEQKLEVTSVENYLDCSNEEIIESQGIVAEINQWFLDQVQAQPRKMLPALKSMKRAIDSLNTHRLEIVPEAVASFGSGFLQEHNQKGMLRVVSELPASPPAPVSREVLPTSHQVSFITATIGDEAEEILGPEFEIPSNATYLPIQEIPGEDGAPGYIILVTEENPSNFHEFRPEESIETISVQTLSPSTKKRKRSAKKLLV